MFGFGKKKKSAQMAKNRIQLVVINDRTNCSPEVLNRMKQEIINVIKKYMIIDEEGIEIQVDKKDENGRDTALFANIPIKQMRK